MVDKNYTLTRYACYSANVSMAAVASLSPLLFMTFRRLYGLSYSMLGALVLIGFCTQLLMDLVFSFWAHKFNITAVVRVMPALTAAGLISYALLPFFFPDYAAAGIIVGSMIFSASGGIAEVFVSPVLAALPSKTPDRDMSRLHSMYAWGVVAVAILSTLYLKAFGDTSWHLLALLWAIVPLYSLVLFLRAPIPQLSTEKQAAGAFRFAVKGKFLLCFFCIFFGGASECTMSQWSSGYLEQALGIDKVWGDVFGVAMFAVMLGLGRSLYASFGKNIKKVLTAGAAGAVVCYIVAAVSASPLPGLIACAMTGFCTSMLWPGSLIVASERFPSGGVTLFALMAAGGDLGGSVGPQIVGVVTDLVIGSDTAFRFAETAGLSVEQLGMKAGILTAALFPIAATVLFATLLKKQRKSD